MAEKKQFLIDFAKLGGPVYIGRKKGEAAREKLKLDNIDSDQGILVEVKIPTTTYSINSSFFLGLFGPSIRASGTREAFLKKFTFKCPAEIMKSVESGIQRALLEHSYLLTSKGKK
jgi:hypothetical protein